MIVERIETADLSAATYRTARRLLDRASETSGALSLSHDELRTVCGTDADGTARRHLIELQAVGIIAYRRNSNVQIWFADWRPDNVVTGDHHGSVVITTDHQARAVISGDHTVIKTEQSSDLTSDHPVINLITTRADCSPGDQLPHTHANAGAVSLLVSNTSPDSEGELTNKLPEPPKTETPAGLQPWEADLSYRLLTDKRVAMKPADANRLSKANSFHAVREAVAHWYMNRKSVRGTADKNAFASYPAIVMYWLDYPELTVVPAVDDQFRRGELWADYQTPDELAAANTPPPPAAAARASPPDGPSPYLDDDPGWLALVSDGLANELAGLVEIDLAPPDGIPVYRFASKQEWINPRNAVPLRKALTVILHKAVMVEFVRPRREEQDGST